MTRNPEISRGEVYRARTIVGLVFLSMIGGGKGGYEIAQDQQRASEQGKREAATRKLECADVSRSSSVIRYESGRAIVRLTALSEKQQEDCEIDLVEDGLEQYDQHSGEGIDLPDGADIVKSSVEVQLPPANDLEASAQAELSEANNGTSPSEGLNKAGMAFFGVVMGGVASAGAAMGIGSLAARRRQG